VEGKAIPSWSVPRLIMMLGMLLLGTRISFRSMAPDK
jgi:hypothetical protein